MIRRLLRLSEIQQRIKDIFTDEPLPDVFTDFDVSQLLTERYGFNILPIVVERVRLRIGLPDSQHRLDAYLHRIPDPHQRRERLKKTQQSYSLP